MGQLYIVALGGNLPSKAGTPEQTLRAAISDLAARNVTLIKVSRLFQTPCFPAGAGPDYVNAAALVSCDLPPRDFLALLHDIEALHGRERNYRWGMRTLDLDLIACNKIDTPTQNAIIYPDEQTYHHWMSLSADDQTTLTPPELILPHPRIQDRGFVLVPMADIAPNWTHPILGLTVLEMLQNLPQDDIAGVKPL